MTGILYDADELDDIVRNARPVDHERSRVPQEDIASRVVAPDPGTTEYTLANLAELSTEAPPPMLVDRLDPESHTILFGTGGVGKGALSCEWLRQLVVAGHRPLIIDYEDHPNEWSRRLDGIGADRSAIDIAYALRKPITSMCDEFAEHIRREGYTYAFIDSVSAAAMADTSQEETASAYAKSVAALGVPVTSLAHVTKGKDERHIYPFGSVHWHTRARVTWSLKKEASGLVLTRRKANNYPPQPSYNVTLTYRDNILRDVSSQTPFVETVGDMARRYLEEANVPLSPKAIADALSEGRDDATAPVSKDAVRMALNRMEKHGRVARQGQLWTIPEDPDGVVGRRL